MRPDQTITLHENTGSVFSCEVWGNTVDGEDTLRIVPVDDADGFNADWSPDTHVFRIWYENSIDHVSDKKPASIEEATEQLRLYLSD